MDESLRVSRIEDWLHGLVRRGVGCKTYAGNLPSTLASGAEEMALVEVLQVEPSSELSSCMGEALANVTVYARPMSNGVERTAVLDALEERLGLAVEQAQDDRYEACEMYRAGGYDSACGYHFRVMALRIKI